MLDSTSSSTRRIAISRSRNSPGPVEFTDAIHVVGCPLVSRRTTEPELCGATAAANHWGNADLLAGVKVNTDAMARVTELEQKGFTLIYQ
jgi:hypothetical protein